MTIRHIESFEKEFGVAELENEYTDESVGEYLMEARGKTMTRPSTTFYHPKADGSGSAVRFSMIPATRSAECNVKIEIAPQNRPVKAGAFPTFDWNDTVVTRLYKSGLSEVLRVLRGIVEAAEIVHEKEVRFSRQNTETPEYWLSVVQTKDGAGRSARYSFTEGEAFALSVTLEQALSHVCFGKAK